MGYFDGDGCITLKSSGYSVGSICCNSKVFLEDVSRVLLEHGIVCRPVNTEHRGRENPIHVLYLSGRENQIKFMDWVYRDSPIYLTRKHDKFLQIPR